MLRRDSSAHIEYFQALMWDPFGEPIKVAGHPFGFVRWNYWRWNVEVPLYAVFAAVAGPTLLVWRFWPKPVKPGHCRCGYGLTGNTSGTCPECGQPFEAKGDAA